MTAALRILLVEDSEDDALLVVRELRRGGYDPVWQRVETEEALRDALQQRNWDVITCDYVMPRFSGPAALAVIRDLGVDTPAIIVSEEAGEEMALSTLTAGAVACVPKHELALLVPAIRSALRDAEARRNRRAK
jgi:CheY-like chemotaxis protein